MSQFAQFKLVMKQTFKSRLKTRGYWIMVGAPLLISLAIAVVMGVINATQSQETPKLGVVNEPKLTKVLQKDEALSINVTGYAKLAQAEQALDDDKLDAILTHDQQGYQLTQRAGATPVSDQGLQRALTEYTLAEQAARLNLSPKQVHDLTESPVLRSSVKSQNGASAQNSEANYALATGLGILVFVFLATYISMISQEIANEKSSRIMEILLAASSPAVQFFGKIGGIGLLALLHGVIYAILLAIANVVVPNNPQMLQLRNVLGGVNRPFLVMSFLLVFVAILLYMVLTAMLAARVNDMSQVNQAVAPVSYLAIIGYVLTLVMSGQPNNWLIVVLSYVPFLSQTLMPARLGLQYATMPEAWLALGIEVVTLLWLSRYGLRVYKQNVLAYDDGNIMKAIYQSLLHLFKPQIKK